MPHYHFNVLDGATDRDEVGTNLADVGAAKREARLCAGKMLADSATIPEPDDEWRIEVTDERGLVLFRLDVIMTDAMSAGFQCQPSR